MNVFNISSDYFYLSSGYRLVPGETTIIDDNIFFGNEGLKHQIDSLNKQGRVQISGFEGLPVGGQVAGTEPPIIPATFDVSEGDIIITSGDASAGFAVNSNEDEIEYGYVRLESETGSMAGLSAHKDDKADGMIFAYKNVDETQKHFDVRINGARILLDPVTVDAEDLANFLIDIGLAEEG